MQGACDIIAERISDDPELTAAVREKTEHTGIIRTEAVDSEEKTVYEMYYESQRRDRQDPESPDPGHKPRRKRKEAESQGSDRCGEDGKPSVGQHHY